ncbi:hypothetical protein L914_18780 [Phytophthora nicotianae]|uniref:Uncharacterized protein n=1 Tax=Phytophthora nicotianae TaxID=4792 RepID=W2MCE9_PHYNI|nr:hypothetical protein L914_18780 [Phytophthora nicotianae]
MGQSCKCSRSRGRSHTTAPHRSIVLSTALKTKETKKEQVGAQLGSRARPLWSLLSIDSCVLVKSIAAEGDGLKNKRRETTMKPKFVCLFISCQIEDEEVRIATCRPPSL